MREIISGVITEISQITTTSGNGLASQAFLVKGESRDYAVQAWKTDSCDNITELSGHSVGDMVAIEVRSHSFIHRKSGMGYNNYVVISFFGIEEDI
jgi:hypothetical protein